RGPLLDGMASSRHAGHAGPCWPMLAHAGPCWPMLAHAGPCWPMLAHAYLAVVRQHAIRGRGPRPRGRRAAPYGSRGAPAPLASRLGKAARPRSHPRLVGLATTTPAARQTITLDPQNQNSSTPAVVLGPGARCL